MPGKTGLLLRGIPVRQFLIVKKKKKTIKIFAQNSYNSHPKVQKCVINLRNKISRC